MIQFELQKAEWDCGIAAMRVFLALAGVQARKIGYRRVKSIANSGPAGTDSAGVFAVMEHFKVNFKVCQSGEKADIEAALCAPALACVDNFNHWVVVQPPFGGKYLVFDPMFGFVLCAKTEILSRLKHRTLGSFILTLART